MSANEPTASLAVRRAASNKLEHEILTSINRLNVDQLSKIIITRNGCENDAKTIKSVVAFLFFSVINPEHSLARTPKEFAVFTDGLLQAIPESLRDWSVRTIEGGPPNKGKSLFRYLLHNCAESYLLRANTTLIKPSEVTISHLHAGDIDNASTLCGLRDEGKCLLSEFIGELGLLGLLSSRVVYEYCLRLMHSISIPRPSASELEALCRLLCSIAPIARSDPSLLGVFKGLDKIRCNPEQYEAWLQALVIVRSD